MKKVLISFSLIFACLCFYSCTEMSDDSLESKVLGTWVISNIDYYSYTFDRHHTYYYNDIIYSFSFMDNGSVEIYTGGFDDDEDSEDFKINKNDIEHGHTRIINYYIQDGVIYVGFVSFDGRDRCTLTYQNGELVWVDRWWNGSYNYETYTVHYKRQK